VPKISGFTIVKNAVKLVFPLEASIRSLLTVCDEVVVNVGKSDDSTLEVVRGIGDPRIKIIETVWATDKQNYVLGDETLRAMRVCSHPWGIYIQADEVLHERGAEELRKKVQEVDGDPEVEALLVEYLHFDGSFDVIATHRRWYRREVRCVRLDPALDIRPYQGAQGFRVGPDHRKIRARLTEAEMFHYGWSRPTEALRAKRENDRVMYPWRPQGEDLPLLNWIPGLKPFTGTHPATAAAYVAAHRDDLQKVGPKFWTRKFIRIYLSMWLEKLTGWRIWEFRNYTIV